MTNKIFGLDIEGAYDRYEKSREKKKEQETKKKYPSIDSIDNLEDYIVLPGKEMKYSALLVSKHRIKTNKSYHETIEMLAEKNQFLLTPKQFTDLAKRLITRPANEYDYDGKGNRLSHYDSSQVLNHLLGLTGEVMNEWLNARFTKLAMYTSGATHNITYKVPQFGKIQEKTESLTPCLMDPKLIDEQDWIINATFHGMPPENVKEGDFEYMSPKNLFTEMIDSMQKRIGERSFFASFRLNEKSKAFDCTNELNTVGGYIRPAMIKK